MKQANQFLHSVDTRVLYALLASVAVGLRIPYLADDFWLDEIWSLNLALSVDSLSAVVTELRFDANHILNTAQMYLIGVRPSWISYRIVSFVSGLVSLFLIYRIAKLFGRHQAVVAVVAASVCFPLVLYSSEARGYAMAIMFSLAAFLVLNNCLYKNIRQAPLFWIFATLAMLSHFSFAYVYGAYLQWSAYVLWKNRENNLKILWVFGIIHTVPLAVFGFLFFYFIQNMGVAGADTSTWAHEISKFVALVYGLPRIGLLTIPYLIFTIAAVIWLTYILRKFKSDYWPLFLLIIIVNPLLLLLMADYGFPQMRYFLLLLPFLLIAVSTILVAIHGHSFTGRCFYYVFLIVFLLSNVILDVSFLKNGRGEYLGAVKYLAENTPAQSFTVASDHDYRNFALLEYYVKFIPGTTSIRYISQDRINDSSPDWYIVHDLSKGDDVAKTVSVANHDYEYSASFFAYDPDVIGWHWHLYKKFQ